MVAQPGMIERALNGEIESDLEPMLAGSSDQPAKVGGRSQFRMEGIVATVLTTNGIGTAGIPGQRRQAVVAPLAIGLADGMDGRKVQYIEPHRLDARQGSDNVVECPMPAGIAERAREEFVPGGEFCLRPFDLNRKGAGTRRQMALGEPSHQGTCRFGREFGYRRGTGRIGRSSDQSLDFRLRRQRSQVQYRLFEFDGDVDTGEVLDLQRVAERAVFIAPRLNDERMAADATRHDCSPPAIVTQRKHRYSVFAIIVASRPDDFGGQNIVPVGKDIGLDLDRPPHDGLGRERTSRHAGPDLLDGNRRAPRGDPCRTPVGLLAALSTFDNGLPDGNVHQSNLPRLQNLARQIAVAAHGDARFGGQCVKIERQGV